MIKRCLFIGSKELGLSALNRIYNINSDSVIGCITIDDKNDTRSKLYDIQKFCSEKNIFIKVLNKPYELKNYIKKIKPDFCIIVGWYWILNKETLELCKDGFIGVHASLLPRYRGGAPLVWAIINGEKETGVSMFYFNEGMDAGDIIGQKRIKIKKSDYIEDILKKANKKTIELIDENYGLILEGKNNRYSQSNEDINYCSQRRPQNGHINWNDTTENIYNFIRAQSKPYPGAYFYNLDGEKVYVYKARIFEYKYYGIPGQIQKVEKNTLLVCCKEGALYIELALDIEEIKQKFKYRDSLK